jgi:hypothetical protein
MSTASERHYYYDGYLLCVEHAPAPDSVHEYDICVATARERFTLSKSYGDRVICDHCRESAAK